MKFGTVKRLWPLLLLIFVSAGCDRPDAYPATDGRVAANQISAPAVSKLDVSEVKFQTGDGLTLRGTFFAARERAGGKVGVVLAPMFPSDQASWFEFAREVAESGYPVLTFDFRGHGWSEGPKDIARTDRDTLAAARFMGRRTKKVFFIGAGLGGAAALRAASEYPAGGVATLSAPEQFRGQAVENQLDGIGGAKLFLAGSRDRDAAETARRLYDAAGEPRELEIISGEARGTDLLKAPRGAARDILLTWLAKYR